MAFYRLLFYLNGQGASGQLEGWPLGQMAARKSGLSPKYSLGQIAYWQISSCSNDKWEQR